VLGSGTSFADICIDDSAERKVREAALGPGIVYPADDESSDTASTPNSEKEVFIVIVSSQEYQYQYQCQSSKQLKARGGVKLISVDYSMQIGVLMR
jgi:hypothetical protein